MMAMPMAESYKLSGMNAQFALFEDVETAIAKSPKEYGLPYIRQKFLEFRDHFFKGDEGTIPKDLPLGFSNTIRALGHCSCRYRRDWKQNANGAWEEGFDILEFGIQLSNAYDFTPKKLEEVLIHEMIHAYLTYDGHPEERHGSLFTNWCNRINSSSDYHITIANDTPVTLNQGMANRVVSDGTVLIVSRDFRPDNSLVCRVPEQSIQWAFPRIAQWCKKRPTCYSCSDGNFKKQFTAVRTKLSGRTIPNATIDEMIESGILKEFYVPDEQPPQDAFVLASPWYGNVTLVLVETNPRTAAYVAMRMRRQQEAHGQESRVSLYSIEHHLDIWNQPIIKGEPRKFTQKMITKDQFNQLVTDKYIDFMGDM